MGISFILIGTIPSPIILFSLILGLTLEALVIQAFPLLEIFMRSQFDSIGFALLGSIIFNIANLLLVTAIDIAGMASAFPIGIGIASSSRSIN